MLGHTGMKMGGTDKMGKGGKDAQKNVSFFLFYS